MSTIKSKRRRQPSGRPAGRPKGSTVKVPEVPGLPPVEPTEYKGQRAEEYRRLRAMGWTSTAIAERYGVTPQAVRAMWGHPDEDRAKFRELKRRAAGPVLRTVLHRCSWCREHGFEGYGHNTAGCQLRVQAEATAR